MPVVFRCIACNKLLEAKDHLAGKPTRCAQCKKVQNIPIPVQPARGDDPDASDRDEYLKFRNWLDKGELDAAKSFDKAMLPLAAGALGLSIAFIKDIAPAPAANSLPYLYAAWTFFAIAICAILIGCFLSQLAWGRERKNFDLGQGTAEESGIQGDEPAAQASPIRYNPWSVAAMVLNITTLVAFILGVGTFVAFCMANVPHAQNAVPAAAVGKQSAPKP